MSQKTNYKCKECGYLSLKWQGKCPECDSWNSFEEVMKESDQEQTNKHSISKNSSLSLRSLDEVLEELKTKKDKRIYPFSASQLNNFWNKGLVAGSLTLLAGEPGLGKSTLSLQFLRSLWNGNKDTKPKLLYVTAEESVFELARRSQRLNIPKEVMVLQANNYEQIEKVILENKPEIVIIDSVQTIFSHQIASSPGSVAQVSTLATQLMALSKSENIAIILVGHVTKSGQIAGPKTLEHLVDSVLTLESSENQNYRTLSFSKHRFGSTSSMLLLKMEESGLEIVADPSLALLENLEDGVGVVYGLGMDKDLSLLVEIQALVSADFPDGKGFGRREALGFSQGKLNTILAILEKYLGMDLKSRDIYVQITGMTKKNYDDSLDLPVLLAIWSSINEQKLSKILNYSEDKAAFAGRLTLSGKLRPATNLEIREKVAKNLGFSYNAKISQGSVSDLFIR